MKFLIKAFGILVLLAGVSLIIYPELIIGWLEANMGSKSLYISAFVVRILLGISFILAAKESKYPVAIKFIGFLFVIAAVIFIFMGQGRFQDFLASLIPEFKPFAPFSGLLSIAFGAFLFFAFSKRSELNR